MMQSISAATRVAQIIALAMPTVTTGKPHQEQYKDAEGRIQPNYYDGYIDGMVSLELAQEDYITELAGRGPEFDPEGNDWEGFLNAVDDRAFLFLSEAVHQIEIYIPENIVAEVSTNA